MWTCVQRQFAQQLPASVVPYTCNSQHCRRVQKRPKAAQNGPKSAPSAATPPPGRPAALPSAWLTMGHTKSAFRHTLDRVGDPGVSISGPKRVRNGA